MDGMNSNEISSNPLLFSMRQEGEERGGKLSF